MKTLKTLTLSLSALFALGLATSAFADEAKEKTITGEAQCAKCAMHQTKKCQTAIESKNDEGKKVTYYLTDNDTAKNFHKEICKEGKKVSATGTVKEVDGKMQLTASKIEEAK